MFESFRKFKKKFKYNCKDFILDILAIIKLQKFKKRRCKNDFITVGFIVQMPEIWDKQKPIFDEMLNDRRFKTKLIVVPDYDFIRGQNGHFDSKKEFFMKQYEQFNCIILYDESKNNLDLGKFDYVFMQRPYDKYLPPMLKSPNVISKTKTVYIPYAYNGAHNFLSLVSEKQFYRNIYLTFTDSIEIKNEIIKGLNNLYTNGLVKIEYLGYPCLEKYCLSKCCEKKNSINSILWTPRWSYDPLYGGSHFLEYKDFFVDFAKKNPRINIIFRPHPLLFDYLRRENMMTSREIDDFMNEINKCGIILDKNEDILETFSKVDLLVTDFSSIIIEYYLTGKPFIYCESPIIHLNEAFVNVLKHAYKVEDYIELNSILNKVINEGDSKYESRIEQIAGYEKEVKGATKRIIDYILEDSKK